LQKTNYYKLKNQQLFSHLGNKIFPAWEENVPSLGIKRLLCRSINARVLRNKGGLLDDKERLSQDLTWFSRKVPVQRCFKIFIGLQEVTSDLT